MPGRHDEYDEPILSACETNCEADQEFSKKKKLDLWAMTKKYQYVPPMTIEHQKTYNIICGTKTLCMRGSRYLKGFLKDF